MLIRHLESLVNSERHVQGENWESRRLLLHADGMGFSLHDTIIHAGTSTRMQYLNHFEAVYCIEGTGTVQDLATGEVIPLKPGSMYALDQHDDHVLTASTTMRMICVFNPPLVGPETHDQRGAYPVLLQSSATTKLDGPESGIGPRETAAMASMASNEGEVAAGDPYWSRVEPQWAAVERQDPVVWGESAGPLGSLELEDYSTNGFHFELELLSLADVNELADEAWRMAHAARPGDSGVIIEPQQGNSDGSVVRSLFRVHESSECFRRVVKQERIVALARQFLGSDVYLHQSRINFKPALDGKEFFWHSDFETWHIEDGMPRMRAVSLSLNLTENHEFNGPLMVIPQSHQTYVRCVGRTPENHFEQSLKKQQYGVPSREALETLVEGGGITAPKGRPGSGLFFECNLMHGSNGNMSPHPRVNLFLVFNSVENSLREPYGGMPPRPEFLGERQPVPVMQLGNVN